ncbi:pilus assembly protein [Phenylobacterium sp. J426]|uniref:TadE/TadG family type IV pilus assembly protein n=1 Tax=Phenylobacterium sp. J426 TaxID=2898439 RepID=UPI002151EAF5|nr:TadE/TadG family type IV pilus assembly protein [Phenylobacterium sp. J426]MCR5875706.1 pilus assembly protein [Phenylobacterium sp. J426]
MNALRRFGRDEHGAAAVEFALILPFLVFMHLAVVEFVQAWQVRTRVGHVAASIADVTSQSRTVSDADLADILLAGDAMMRPYPTAPLGERITSLTANAQGAVVVDWSVGRNFGAAPAATAPPNFLAPNESIIVAEARYDYRPAISVYLLDKFTLRQTAYVRPRVATKVEKR